MDTNSRAFTEAHIAAVQRYVREGPLTLTEAEVEAVGREDPALGAHVRAARERAALVTRTKQTRALIASKLRPTPTPTPKAAPVVASRLSSALTAALGKAIGRAMAPALRRLEERIQALEAKSIGGVSWAGVHVTGCEYREGSLTTRSGSLWVAHCTTATRPGDDGSDWTLIVKRGAYAHEAER